MQEIENVARHWNLSTMIFFYTKYLVSWFYVCNFQIQIRVNKATELIATSYAIQGVGGLLPRRSPPTPFPCYAYKYQQWLTSIARQFYWDT